MATIHLRETVKAIEARNDGARTEARTPPTDAPEEQS
jgi:hypothetical protein